MSRDALISSQRPGPGLPVRPERHILASAKGSGFLAGGSFFEFASRFLIAFLLARAVGAEGYGLYNLAISAGALSAGTAALGLDDAMVRYIAIQARRRDQAGLWGTLQIGLGVSLASSLALGLVLLLAAEPLGLGLFNEPKLVPLLRLFAVIVPFLTVSNVLAAVAKGFRRMDYAAFAENVVMSVTRVALLAVLTLGGLDVFAAAVVFGISDVAATVTLILLINREFPLRGVFRPQARREYGEVFRFALPLWLSGLLLQFRKNLEILLLGALSVASSVGLFAIVGRINMVSRVPYHSIVGSVKPVLAELHSLGERDELKGVYRASTRWAFMCAVPFVLPMVLYAEPILSIFGSAFTAGATALLVLALAELADAGTGTCGSMIDMSGHTRVKLANSVAWLALLFASSLLLIPRWGVLGAAVATLISTATINAARVVEVWLLERLQPYDRAFLKPVAAGLAAYGLGTAFNIWGPAHPLLRLTSGAALVIGSYAGACWLLGLAPEDRTIVRLAVGKVTRRVRRRVPPPATGRPATPAWVLPAAAASGRSPGTAANQRGPILVGGLDRSGKTTLAGFLSSHPNIAVPAVGDNMWTYFYRQFGDLRRAQNFDRCLAAMLRYKHVRFLGPDPERIRREFAEGPATYARLFALFLIHFAERAGKPRWGGQAGLIERYADHMFAAYPGLRIVHVVRDPRDRYEASLARWPDGKGRAGGATARWRYSTSLAERNLRRYPDGYLVVRFEDLVTDTEATLRQVCRFVGEDFTPAMLAMPGAPKLAASLAASAGATTDGGLLSPEYIGGFRGRLAPQELAFIQLHAAAPMRAYGHRPESLDLTPSEWARFGLVHWPNQMARMLAWRGVEELQQRFPRWVRRTPGRRMIVEAQVDAGSDNGAQTGTQPTGVRGAAGL